MSTSIQTINFPFERSVVPVSFSFPSGKRVVLLGYDKSDINLKDWSGLAGKDNGRLYSPHVQFHYISAPSSQWHILSLRGLRRGSKAVFVNGKHIFSGHGLVPLQKDSRFSVGNFEFQFCPDQENDLSEFENPTYLVSTIETDLKLLVEQLSILLPDSVYSAENKSIDWDLVYFSQLLNSITKNEKIKPILVSLFGSMGKVKDHVAFLVNIRNKVFHPSKGPLDKPEREVLSSIYIKFKNAANKAVESTAG